MSITGLTIQDFRNIQSTELTLSPSLNLIYGQNGSGKTSLLEAIHYLSTAQSFRTQNIESLIKKGCSHLTVAANIKDNGQTKRIGLRRSPKQIIRRINQETVHRQTDITKELPVRILHPDSHKLVSGAPSVRRSFLDWGCFYHHSSFLKTWSSVKAILKQRNALLKSHYNLKVLESLNQQFTVTSDQIDKLRSQYMLDLSPLITSYTEKILGPAHTLDLEYQRGWKTTLSDQLTHDMERDRRFKRTHSGPHRADIQIRFNNEDARNNASRGQQKLIVVILTLSQIHLFRSQTQSSGILLIDDLPSELDQEHQNLFIEALHELQQQLFITAIDPDTLDLKNWTDSRMFHVKHGQFTEVV